MRLITRHNTINYNNSKSILRAVGPFPWRSFLKTLLVQIASNSTTPMGITAVLHPSPWPTDLTMLAGTSLIDRADYLVDHTPTLPLIPAVAVPTTYTIPLDILVLYAPGYVHIRFTTGTSTTKSVIYHVSAEAPPPPT